MSRPAQLVASTNLCTGNGRKLILVPPQPGC
jgi:hypothetical protein